MKNINKKQIRILSGVLGAVVLIAVIWGQGSNFLGSLFVDKKILVAQTESAKSKIETDKKIARINQITCDVAVVGGGAGGTAAAIQSARLGVKTCLIEETDWLGGMLSSAGVAAIDGHEETSSGIFKEIKERVIKYYESIGKLDQTRQCKVSNFCFEPAVGNKIVQEMAAETKNLTVYLKATVNKVYKEKNVIKGVLFTDKDGNQNIVTSKVLVDATEFGDMMFLAAVPYSLGYEKNTGESLAAAAEDCIQPLKYVAILKKFDNPKEPVKPANYDPNNYRCLNDKTERLHSSSDFDLNHLLNYGKMPDGKLLINIPSHSCGNDFHATADELDNLNRQEILEMAKDYSRGFIYYVQTELGLSDWGIYNEFGTSDGFAKIPYVRESRRLVGVDRLTEKDVVPDKISGRAKFYPSSIAIGDYPIDLHYCQTGIGDVFYEVNPYQIPYEIVVPKDIDGLLVAEKNISVSHIVNGTTRLQPVVMSVGQAVGAAAALSVVEGVQPRNVDIEKLQDELLRAKSIIYYFSDVALSHFAYSAITKMAMAGLMTGYPDLTFKPEQNILKGDFIRILGKLQKIRNIQDIVAVSNKLKEAGIVLDSSLLEKPDSALNYGDFYPVVVDQLLPALKKGQKLKDKPASYAIYSAEVSRRNIVRQPHFAESPLTRAEFAVIMDRIMEL